MTRNGLRVAKRTLNTNLPLIRFQPCLHSLCLSLPLSTSYDLDGNHHRPFISSSHSLHNNNDDTSKETLPISEAVANHGPSLSSSSSSNSGAGGNGSRPPPLPSSSSVQSQSAASYHNRTSSYQSNYEHLKLASSSSTPLKFNGSNKFSLITSEFLTLTPRRKGQILEKWHLEFQDQNNNNHFIPISHQQQVNHHPHHHHHHQMSKHGRSGSSGSGIGVGVGGNSPGTSSSNSNTLGFGNDELCNSATLKLGSDLIYSRNKYPSSDLNALKLAVPQPSAISIDNNNGSIKSSLSPAAATSNESHNSSSGGGAGQQQHHHQPSSSQQRKGFRAPSNSRDFTIAV